MKSIIKEASSVAKAIEKAWVHAGKPKEFSVKIFEEEKRNFIGFTITNAKIALFFEQSLSRIRGDREDDHTRQNFEKKKPRGSFVRTEKKTDYRKTQKIQKKESSVSENIPQAPLSVQKNDSEKEIKSLKNKTVWTEEMIKMAQKWIEKSLNIMEKKSVQYNIDANNYYLRFILDSKIIEDENKERELFRNFSFLMLQTLKRKFKRPFRGFKIVITR